MAVPAAALDRSLQWRGRVVAWASYGQGPALVLCHGTPWSSRLWADYARALSEYSEALRLNPFYADAHFYLAVTLEKNGQSQDARTHWKAYQQLAPNGEWVELAREFSD